MSTEADPKPAPSLDESVESLLSEMSQAADRLNAELEASKPKAAEAAQPQLEDLAAAVDEMVKEVAAAVAPPGDPTAVQTPTPKADTQAPTAEPVAKQPADHDIQAAKAAEEPATAEETAEEPAPQAETDAQPEPVAEATEASAEETATDPDDGVESLATDAFASLSDELLAGLDRDDPTIVVGNAPATGSAGTGGGERESFDSLTDELLSGLGEPKAAEAEPVAETKEHAAKPEPAAATTVAHESTPPPPPPPPPTAPTPTHTAEEEAPHTTTAARRVLHAAGHTAAQVAIKAEPHALRAVAKISAPLQSRPRTFRDTLGWLGVYTLFVGLTLLVYVCFIHKAPSPEPAHPGVKLADRNDRKGAAGEVVRSDEHGHEGEHGAGHADAAHADDGHGKADAGKDAHGKKDDGHGAKKDDAKKGSTKAPAPPKLPTPQFKAGPGAAKKDAKPEAKKDAGHGGGH